MTRTRIGVDLGGTKIEGIALAADGRELARRRVATPRGDYAGTVTAIVHLVRDLERRAGGGMPVGHATVGVGMPGAISPHTGVVKNANSTWLNGRPFHADLAAALGRPVRTANDADCFAMSEAVDGAAAGAAIAFGVILGTGVGGGAVIGGRLLAGANAIAGEWGHTPLPWPRPEEIPGPACYCGRRGCIEAWLSGPALARDHAAHAPSIPGRPAATGEDVANLADAGDPAALATLARYCDRLARGLAVVVNILDPEVIVLGGGLSRISRLYAEVPPLLARHAFSDHLATRLVPPRHGDSSGVRGAAWLWLPQP